MRRPTAAWTATALAALALAGCRSDHLIFTTTTKVGVELSATDGVPTSAVLGYKRFEGAIVPVEDPQSGAQADEAASVFAAIDMDNRWLGGLDLFQVFATGEAANNVSRSGASSGLVQLLDSMHRRAAAEKAGE